MFKYFKILIEEDDLANTDSSDESDTDDNAGGSNLNNENDVIKYLILFLYLNSNFIYLFNVI